MITPTKPHEFNIHEQLFQLVVLYKKYQSILQDEPTERVKYINKLLDNHSKKRILVTEIPLDERRDFMNKWMEEECKIRETKESPDLKFSKVAMANKIKFLISTLALNEYF